MTKYHATKVKRIERGISWPEFILQIMVDSIMRDDSKKWSVRENDPVFSAM